MSSIQHGRTLLWEFIVRGLFFFVVLISLVSFVLSSFIEDNFITLAIRSLDINYDAISDDMAKCGKPGNDNHWRIFTERAEYWRRVWRLAGIGVICGSKTILVCSNKDIKQELALRLKKAEAVGTAEIFDVPQGRGHSVPVLSKTYKVSGHGDAKITLYSYYAEEARMIKVFQLVTVASLLVSLVVLSVALGLVVKRASDELHRYSNSLEQRNAELQATKLHLLHSSKLAMLGELSASVAHEIRNPLASISAGLQLASERARDAQIDLGEVFNRLDSEVDRLNRVLSGMLKFSRPGQRKNSSYSLNVLAEKVLLLVKKRAKDHRIRIEKRLSDDIPELFGDPAQMEQVVLNLVLNAVQAQEADGGIVSVISGWRGEEGQEEVWMEIRDHGPGVPADIMARLFTPFLTSKGEEGTGLGLAISKSIVESQGGRLTIENLDSGALARIALPLKIVEDESVTQGSDN